VDIRGLVYGIVNRFPSALRPPVRWVADAIFGVWDDVSNVFRFAVPSWSRIFGGVNAFVWSVATALFNGYKTAYWIAFDWLPRFVAARVNEVLTWAQDLVNALAATVQQGLSYVANLARTWVDAALDALSTLRNWALEWVGRIVDTLNAVVRLVSTLLTDPRVLVAWILAAMVDALVAWVDTNLERLAEALWARRAAIILRSAERIEALIARLL
jgi:hypothetical protein